MAHLEEVSKVFENCALKQAQNYAYYHICSDLPIPQRYHQAKYQRVKCPTEFYVETAKFHLFWVQPTKYHHVVEPKPYGTTFEIYKFSCIKEGKNKLSQKDNQLELEIS